MRFCRSCLLALCLPASYSARADDPKSEFLILDKKLYAVRDDQGEFADIQTYKRAHGQDITRKSKAELEAAAKKKKTAKKVAKPTAAQKKAKKQSAKRDGCDTCGNARRIPPHRR